MRVHVRWLISRREMAAMLRRLKAVDMDAIAAAYRKLAETS